MSIMDMFRAKPAAPAAAPVTQVPPGNMQPPITPAAQSPGAEPNGVIPAVPPAIPAEPAKPESPLDAYKDLWNTAPTDPTKEAAPPAEITPELLNKSFAEANFASVVPADSLAAIEAGGEGAAAAFTSALEAVAKNVMVQSTMVGNKLTQKAVTDAVAATEAKIPELLRQQSSANHLKNSNPVYSNDAVKPFIDAARAQFLVKHPDATNEQITTHVQDYVKVMGEAFNPQATPTDPNSTEMNWENFLQGP